MRTIEQTIFRNRHIIECRQGLEIQFDLECSVLLCAEFDVLEEMYAVTTKWAPGLRAAIIIAGDQVILEMFGVIHLEYVNIAIHNI